MLQFIFELIIDRHGILGKPNQSLFLRHSDASQSKLLPDLFLISFSLCNHSLGEFQTHVRVSTRDLLTRDPLINHDGRKEKIGDHLLRKERNGLFLSAGVLRKRRRLLPFSSTNGKKTTATVRKILVLSRKDINHADI